MKLPETIINFTASPRCDTYENFAIECRRTRSYITHEVARGSLNWGVANGIKMIILDDLAEAFKNRCHAANAHRREKNRTQTN